MTAAAATRAAAARGRGHRAGPGRGAGGGWGGRGGGGSRRDSLGDARPQVVGGGFAAGGGGQVGHGSLVLVDFLLAAGAAGDVGAEGGGLVGWEGVEGVGAQKGAVVLAVAVVWPAHSWIPWCSSARLSRIRPERILALMVPSGAPSMSATSR